MHAHDLVETVNCLNSAQSFLYFFTTSSRPRAYSKRLNYAWHKAMCGDR